MNLQNPHPPTPAPKDHKEQQDLAQRRIRYFVGFAIAGLIVLWLLSQFELKDLLVPTTVIPCSDFKTKLVQGRIVKITLNTENITGEMKNPDLQASGTATVAFETAGSPASDPKVVEQLQGAGR